MTSVKTEFDSRPLFLSAPFSCEFDSRPLFPAVFDDGVTTMAQRWHFLGREGVPIAYSWPAYPGGPGGPGAYEYTRESGIFTGYHLKQTIRLIAACPAVGDKG
jgi:esterase/lipase superfamily enzyme